MASRLDPLEPRIRELLTQGRGIASIANEIGAPTSTVRDYVSRNGLRAKALARPSPVASGQVSRVEVLEAEVAELRRDLTKQRRTDVNTERVVAAIERALSNVEHSVLFADPPAVKATDAAHHRQLAVWSDWHGGENVDPETVGGLNDYDWEIMERRVDEMLQSMLSHQRNSPELVGLDVAIVGDMSSGSNHYELATTNDYPLAEQGVKMGYLIGRALEYLAPHYPELRVFSIVGNHPRLVKKPAAKDTHDNMDWVSSMIAKEFLRDVPNLSSFRVGRTSLIHEIAGRTFYVWHGDGIRSTMPGVPWGGVMRRTNEIGRQQRRRIDHYLLGHFHSPNVVQGGRIIMNGALKGVDEYSLKYFGGGDDPTQLLLMFDEKRSRLTDTKYITLSAGVPQ